MDENQQMYNEMGLEKALRADLIADEKWIDINIIKYQIYR